MKERPILFSGPMIRALLERRKSQTRRIIKPQPPSIDAVRAKTGDSYHLFRDKHRPGDVWRVAGGVSVVKELCGQSEWRCPYGQPGDRLWVRETWAYNGQASKNHGPPERRREGYVTYAADGAKATHCFPDGPMLPSPQQTLPARKDGEDEFSHKVRVGDYYTNYFRRFRSPRYMPRWASRITLEVTDVRVQRLQEISDADAIAEGAQRFDSLPSIHPYGQDPRWSMESPSSTAECLGTPRMAFAAYLAKIHGPSMWEDNLWAWAVSFKVVEP